jgi:TonB family protein
MASDLKINSRDSNQRSLGCISFSMIAHFGFLGVLLFTPSMKSDLAGMAKGGGSSSSQNMKVDFAADGTSKPELSREVLLADNNDETAVALPQKEMPKVVAKELPPVKKAVKKPAQKSATPPESKPVVAAKPILTDDQPDEPFQPESIADVDPVDKTKELEVLSPAITDNPPEELSSDARAAAAEEETQTPPTAQMVAASAPRPVVMQSQPRTQNGEANGEGNGEGSGHGPSQGPLSGGMASMNAGTAPMSQQIVDSSLRNPLPGNPLPAYPQQDQLTGRQGTTMIIGHVYPDGSVGEVVIDKSSGSPMMDRAAVDTFKLWKFAKGPEALVRKGFAFTLTGEAKLVRAKLGGR